jgi:hypothetical protein
MIIILNRQTCHQSRHVLAEISHCQIPLSTTCYVIRSVKPYVNKNVLIMIYHSLFHSVMNYGIIFWGNSSHNTQVFKMQKEAIRIITGCGNRESCRNLFKELNILPLMSQYILSLHLCQIIWNSILLILKYII